MIRLVVSAIVGTGAAFITGTVGKWAYAPAVGWDVAAVIYCAVVWTVTWSMDSEATAALVKAEDPSRAVGDVLTVSACVASLAGVWIVLVSASSAHGAGAVSLAGLGLASVAVSWFTLHTIFGLRYALLYYGGREGGVNFHCQDAPCYKDFYYLSLTVGMTFQVSDTNLMTTRFRATALRHALLSYLFGAIILAATINLIASLGSRGSIG
jgi:uncharacterized membrane protein